MKGLNRVFGVWTVRTYTKVTDQHLNLPVDTLRKTVLGFFYE